MKVLLINGSPNEKGCTYTALKEVADKLNEHGPHAFVSQRQLSSSNSPSPPVFLPISAHFTATPGILITSPILKKDSFGRTLWVEPIIFTSDLPSRLHTLYTQ